MLDAIYSLYRESFMNKINIIESFIETIFLISLVFKQKNNNVAFQTKISALVTRRLS